MLLPKRTKFRRQHRGRFKGVSNANTIVFGDYGLQALEPVWITSRQIEATRYRFPLHQRFPGRKRDDPVEMFTSSLNPCFSKKTVTKHQGNIGWTFFLKVQ